jgi:hypothetical protein
MRTFKYERTVKQKFHVYADDEEDSIRLLLDFSSGQSDDRIILMEEEPRAFIFIGLVKE